MFSIFELKDLVRDMDLLMLLSDGERHIKGIVSSLGVSRSLAWRMIHRNIDKGYIRKCQRGIYMYCSITESGRMILRDISPDRR